jgi:hypothetical protein
MSFITTATKRRSRKLRPFHRHDERNQLYGPNRFVTKE